MSWQLLENIEFCCSKDSRKNFQIQLEGTRFCCPWRAAKMSNISFKISCFLDSELTDVLLTISDFVSRLIVKNNWVCCLEDEAKKPQCINNCMRFLLKTAAKYPDSFLKILSYVAPKTAAKTFKFSLKVPGFEMSNILWKIMFCGLRTAWRKSWCFVNNIRYCVQTYV